MDQNQEQPKKKRGRKPKKEKPDLSKTEPEEIKEEELDGYNSSFSIKTVQSAALRLFFMSLKKYCDMITLNITKERITIGEIVNPVLIYSNLFCCKFEDYMVDEDIKLHIHLETFYNIVRYVTNNDIVTFQKNKSEKFWSFIIYNEDNQKRNKYDINLIRREYNKPEIPSPTFNYEFTFPCENLKDLFKRTKHLQSDTLTVEVNDKSIKFICKNSEVTSETNFGAAFCWDGDSNLVSGDFPYKEMALCTHFSDLCNIIYLYIKDDYPLIIKYDVANLGYIRFCFAPVEIDEVISMMN